MRSDDAHHEAEIGNEAVVHAKHGSPKTATVALTVPALRLDDRLRRRCVTSTQHELERAAVRSLCCRQARRFSLTDVRALVSGFKTAHHRKHVLRTDIPREPTQKLHANTGPVLWGIHTVVPEQLCPARGVVLF